MQTVYIHTHTCSYEPPQVYRTKQAMYVPCDIVVHSCNHCCSGKARSITFFECLFV